MGLIPPPWHPDPKESLRLTREWATERRADDLLGVVMIMGVVVLGGLLELWWAYR